MQPWNNLDVVWLVIVLHLLRTVALRLNTLTLHLPVHAWRTLLSRLLYFFRLLIGSC